MQPHQLIKRRTVIETTVIHTALKMDTETVKVEDFTLKVDSELRFEIETLNRKVVVELKDGKAELFGTELVKGKQYEFHTGAKVAIFTYHGCKLNVKGEMDVHYIAKETPMVQYFNAHAAVEELRVLADEKNENGPIVMVVGPCDVGKSTVCKILLNYAVRQGRSPIFVDLDVGQGSISTPGTIGALLVEQMAHVEDGFSQRAPLVYQFGHSSPSDNDAYYKLLLSKLAEITLKRLQTNKKIRSSGMVINTCGWVKGAGYKHILDAASKFQVAAIIVLDQERLYNELLRDVPKTTQVVFLQKSGGVVERSRYQRSEARVSRVREYFYGKRTPLYPHSFDVKWSDISICKVGAPDLPDSCLPLGMKADSNKTKLLPIQPSLSILHHILALTFCENIDDDVSTSNIAGFVCVTNVDVKRQLITVLSPQPRPLPNNIFLLSDIQFMDSH